MLLGMLSSMFSYGRTDYLYYFIYIFQIFIFFLLFLEIYSGIIYIFLYFYMFFLRYVREIYLILNGYVIRSFRKRYSPRILKLNELNVILIDRYNEKTQY